MNFLQLNFTVILKLFLIIECIIQHISLVEPKLCKEVHISFAIKRNYTGHYLTKWSIDKDSPQLPERIVIDLKTSVSEQDGIQSFHLGGFLSVPPDVPAGYEYFPGIGYYKFYMNSAKTFAEAVTKCEKDGTHLAIINSEAEEGALLTLFKRYPTAKAYAYLGFHDMVEEGKFVTIFGEPLEATNFTKWAPNEPGVIEDCGSLFRQGGLNDLPCDETEHGPWPFICEFDLSWNVFN